jgi:hypothetical protein
MAMDSTGSRAFTTRIERDARGRVIITLPFDPAEAWGARARYHVTGIVGDRRVRGALSGEGTDARLVLGPAWCQGYGVDSGDQVQVILMPEGPQHATVAPDVADALAARPEAREFFDALATFYRRGYLRWVDATKRRPDERARRIAEMIELLAAGQKERR